MNSSPHFGSETEVSQHPNQLAAEIDGQMVVMTLAQGTYVGFDGIATTIWHRLKQPQRVADLCQGLIRDYDGDPATIRRDTLDLLTRLHELGLIQATSDTAPT